MVCLCVCAYCICVWFVDVCVVYTCVLSICGVCVVGGEQRELWRAIIRVTGHTVAVSAIDTRSKAAGGDLLEKAFRDSLL